MRKIQVSRNSWHYKLHDFILDSYPYYEGLCDYFWAILACIALVPIMTPYRLVNNNDWLYRHENMKFSIGILSYIWYIIFILMAFSTNLKDFTYSTMLGLVFSAMVVTMFGIYALRDRYTKWQNKRQKEYWETHDINQIIKERQEKWQKSKVHLTIEFLRGLKNKYCPMIEFTDDKK